MPGSLLSEKIPSTNEGHYALRWPANVIPSPNFFYQTLLSTMDNKSKKIIKTAIYTKYKELDSCFTCIYFQDLSISPSFLLFVNTTHIAIILHA